MKFLERSSKMLAKLLKYDLKKEIPFFALIYLIMIVCAGLGRLLVEFGETNFTMILGYIFQGTLWAGVANLFINNLLRLWSHFRRDLYGDEGYLLNTLPVKSSTIFWSKFLTSLIIMIINIVISSSTVLLAYGDNVVTFLDATKEIYLLIGTLALEIFAIYAEGILGIVLTHHKNIKSRRFSVLYAFLAFLASQTIIFLSIFTLSIFDENVKNLLFATQGYIDFEIIKKIIYIGIAGYTLTILTCSLLSAKSINDGINLE